MKIQHYSLFNNSSKILNWEALRNDESEAPYFLPYSREEFLKKVDTLSPSKAAEIIINETVNLKIQKAFSIGCGIASLEYQIKKFSKLSVIVSDYNSSVLRLKNYNIFDDCLQLDAFMDIFPVDESYLMIFPRIDTEFDDQQLETLFLKCKIAGIKYIWFIPAELLNFKIFIVELKILLVSILKGKSRVFCGYARSKSAFRRLWGKHYRLVKEYEAENRFFLLQAIE